MDPNEKKSIQVEMKWVMDDLEKQGVKLNTSESEMTGLGDVVEASLQKFGITEERFKKWFNLKECNCSKRKKWLNNLFSWKKKKDEM